MRYFIFEQIVPHYAVITAVMMQHCEACWEAFRNCPRI